MEQPLSEYHSSRLAEERKVNIYYIPIQTNEGERQYFYVAAGAILHEQFVKALEVNQIPDFAVVVAHGEGEPTEDVKQKMLDYYDFKHDESEDFGFQSKQAVH